MDNTNMEIAQKLKVSGKTPSFILLRTQTQNFFFLGGGEEKASLVPLLLLPSGKFSKWSCVHTNIIYFVQQFYYYYREKQKNYIF